MKLEEKQILIDCARNADLLLVGIGEEWGVSFEEMLKEESFAKNYAKLIEEKDKEQFVPVLQREYLQKFHDEKLKKAYENLYELIEGKNYFLISMNKDRYPEIAGLNRKKCVFPCGGYEMFQCDMGCTDELIPAADVSEKIYQEINQAQTIGQLQMPLCPHCGNPMVYNNLETVKYLEQGYLSDWEYYMQWLQGTVNKRLCLIELGVSMKFPSVIRWPFEKTTYYNQKSKMFRIHHALSQSAEGIQDRCYSCMENSVDYMANLFVS